MFLDEEQIKKANGQVKLEPGCGSGRLIQYGGTEYLIIKAH
jgi:hypothetical protein